MQQAIYHTIFNKELTEPDNESFLNTVLEKYPYFATAQYYLLKNTDLHNYSYEEKAAKTALFFNDHFLLNATLINDGEIIEEEPVTAAPENIITPTVREEMVMEEETKPEEHHEEIAAEQITAPETAQPETDTQQSPENLQETIDQYNQMLFEPLHASDYFASQGIKLSDAILTNDKLGQQLKSFTSWLKTMKKVHPDKLPANGVTEIAVQTLAEKSNKEAEIITEAMADAYIIQEKPDKAAEIYSKLSLLNPAKSAYFAAKIESLKQ